MSSCLKLFQDTDVDTIPLTEYVRCFLDSGFSGYGKFQLPPIQRNAVWNVAQVERLWDSLLRGFPIGSFLLSERDGERRGRGLNDAQLSEAEKGGFFLLDGQQRTRAITLGFKPGLSTRLWIDVNPIFSPENQNNDRKFLFRLISNNQPWGMDDRDPSKKLHDRQKYDARMRLFGKSVRYDYNIKINLTPIGELESDAFSKSPWPVKSSMPVPFDVLMNLCGGLSGKFREPTIDEIRPFTSNYVDVTNAHEHFKSIISGIRGLIDLKNEKNIRHVVLLKQNKESTDDRNEYALDPMEVLFTRVNSGGTPLGGEEMAYSLLKSNWDKAYDLVSLIVNDDQVGYILPPTGLVMAASRLARYIQGRGDESNPYIGVFRKWISEPESNGVSFLGVMKKLVDIDEHVGKSPFHETLEIFCRLATYNNASVNELGLPRKILLTVKPSLLHPVFIWIYFNRDNHDILEKSKMGILRYLIFCTIGVTDHNKASRQAVKVIRSISAESVFPDKEIYLQLIDEESASLLPNVNEFNSIFNSEPNGLLRTWNELFDLPDDKFNSFRAQFWGNKNLLLWFQRRVHAKWFDGYNPMSNDDCDTPFDYDHILPYSHLIGQGHHNYYLESREDANRFGGSRGLYVNSIGNYRIWPYWANRSDGNNCHTYKLRMEQGVKDDDTTARELGLSSVADFFSASEINIADNNLWYSAGGEPRVWPNERRVSWQKAVENRILFLYKKFFDEFNFKEWAN